MPCILFLVVCDLSVTIETLWLIKPFNKVDLPTFGRPKMATKPDFIILNRLQKRQIEGALQYWSLSRHLLNLQERSHHLLGRVH